MRKNCYNAETNCYNTGKNCTGSGLLAEEGSHLLAGGYNDHLAEDLDRPLVNLGGDVQRLEEGRLRRVHTGGASWHGDRQGRNNAGLRGGAHTEGADLGLQILQVALYFDTEI